MPRHPIRLVLATGLLAALAACAARTGDATTATAAADDAFATDARAAVGQLRGALMRELRGALETGGPVDAIEVCRTRAPQIADEVSVATGRRVGRVSARNRNPDNHPGPAEAAVLAAFEARPDLADTVIHVDGAPVYLGAIRIGARTCLTCHGPRDSLDPALIAVLDEHYPDDRATGFGIGELRGAFVVR